MTTHTPGPWHWGHNSASDASTACIEIRPDGPYRGNVADLQSCEHISAAPDLLEALIAMEQEKSDYMTRNSLGDPSVETTNKMARAAIAKATGA